MTNKTAQGTIKVDAKYDPMMSNFLSHYCNLPQEQRNDFIHYIGGLLENVSADNAKVEENRIEGLKLLLLESAHAHHWDSFEDLIGRLTVVPDVYKVLRPTVKKLVVLNNTDAVDKLQQSIYRHHNVLSDHQQRYQRLKFSYESLWRPAFDILSAAPSYVDIPRMLSTMCCDLNARDMMTFFTQRLAKVDKKHPINGDFFQHCYNHLLGKQDCKDHYPKYIMFRYSGVLSEEPLAPLLEQMCQSMVFKDVMEKGPSEDFMFPPDGDDWIGFLYNPPHELDQNNWFQPAYLQPNNRFLAVERTIALTKAFERHGFCVALHEMPGVEWLRKNSGPRLSEVHDQWLTQRLLQEHLQQAVDGVSHNSTTPVRKI